MKETITLKDSKEFNRVLSRGAWSAGDLMSLYLLRTSSNINQLGIAVGKKFSKSSVKRNRVKRLIKEAYRLNEDKICKGYLIVILLKNNAIFENINFNSVEKDLFKCLKKAGILLCEEECNA